MVHNNPVGWWVVTFWLLRQSTATLCLLLDCNVTSHSVRTHCCRLLYIFIARQHTDARYWYSTAAISEVCQRGLQDDIQCDPDAAWSRLARSEWSSARPQRLRLALLYNVVTGHVAVGPDQIGLVAADNRTRANHRFKFRAVGASSSGLRSSFADKTIGDWNHLPAVVVEQESPAAFKNQLDRLAPVACRMP